MSRLNTKSNGWLITVAIAAACAVVISVQYRENQGLMARVSDLGKTVDAQAPDSPVTQQVVEVASQKAEEPVIQPGVEVVPAIESPGSPLVLSAAEWRNAGSASPEAAFETALWAASREEWDVLESLISIEGVEATKIEALFASLSEEARDRFGTARRLVVTAMVRDMSYSEVTLRRLVVQRNGDSVLDVAFNNPGKQDPAAKVHANIRMRRADQGWKLVFPLGAVDRYAAMLKDSPLQ